MPEPGRPLRGTLVVSGDAAADNLVNSDPLALMIAMLLDQQIPIEWAFASPLRLAQRLGGALDASEIAAMDPQELIARAAQKPAIHRFPAMMARRIHKLCEHLVDEYQGRAELIWADADDAELLYRRLLKVPGYGAVKSRILIAVLAKRFDRRPDRWEAVAGEFASEDLRSVADLGDPSALSRLRAKRQAAKPPVEPQPSGA